MGGQRARWTTYLVVVHALSAIALAWLVRDRPVWILAIEVALVVSLVIGFRLIRAVFRPIEVLRAATDLMESRDFASRFRESGNPEMDGLVRVYNRMAEELQQERVRNEEQETFLQRILSASATGVITLDLEGQVSAVNPSAARMLTDRTALDVLIGRRLEELDAPIADAIATAPPGRASVLPLPGRRRIRVYRGAFVDRGFPREFFVLDELTEELRRTERAAYDKLIRTMSHEVNNTAGGVTSLLSSCLTYAGQLDADDRDDFRSALTVASDRTKRLNEFVRAFADVVRLPRPSRERVHVEVLLDGLVRFVQSECSERRISLLRGARLEHDECVLDSAQMERALVNVLRNAIDAVGEDGEIRIDWERSGERYVLCISDTGPGIPADVEPHLFEPFYSSKSGGRGVGLTLVQEILDAHALSFSLSNRTDRGGAVFRIWFPAA
jgi:nitrogen fixation/metabolism regulation signal transduction histidine kinase